MNVRKPHKWLRGILIVLLIIIIAAITARIRSKNREDIQSENGGRAKKTSYGYNVVLITIDALRADQLGCYGQKTTKTPAMDFLANEGVLFEQAYSTIPYSVPSVYSILTSRFPAEYTLRTRLEMGGPESETIAQALKRNGYITIGVSGNELLNKDSGCAAGFDKFDDTGKMEMQPSGDTIMSALSELDRVAENREFEKGEKKFFLWIHFADPSLPYTAPENFEAYGKPGAPYEIGKFNPDKYKRISSAVPFPESPDIRRFMKRNGITDLWRTIAPEHYMAEVSYTDFCVSLLLKKLDALNLKNSTSVILTADHGTSFGERDIDWSFMYTLYQDVARVPLIIYQPGYSGAGRIGRAVSLLDIKPTILDITGARPADVGMQGVSLKPFLQDYAPEQTRVVFARTVGFDSTADSETWKEIIKPKYRYRHEITGPEGQWTMASTGRYKLIRIPTKKGVEYELYDLKNDPGEAGNIVKTKKSLASDLGGAIDNFLAVNKNTSSTGHVSAATARTLHTIGYLK
jgi:arylsulfatase A-like enzyme